MGDVLEVNAGTDRAPAADRGSADVVARAVAADYAFGFVSDIDTEVAPQGSERRRRRADLREARRTRLVARVAPRCLPPLPHPGGADVGSHQPPADRLPADVLLGGAEAEGPRAREPRRHRPGDPFDVREARHLPRRAEAPVRDRGRRRHGLGLSGNDVQGSSDRGGRDLLLVLRRGQRPPRTGAPPPRLRRRLSRQLLRRTELRSVLGRIVLLRPGRGRLPDGAVHLLPDQRRGHRPVRADPDRRRGGGLGQLPRRLHRPDA